MVAHTSVADPAGGGDDNNNNNNNSKDSSATGTQPLKARASTGPKKQFTWEEVSKHNTSTDAYVSVRGKVYDITKFIDRHPGGRDTLLVGAGRDVTQVFEMYHTFDNAKNLEKFYVGDLVSSELPTFPTPSPFFVTLKTRVEDYFKKTGQDPKWAPWMFVRYFWIFFTVLVCWYAQLFVFRDSFPLQIVLAATQGFACALIGLFPMHDASHFSITRNPAIWRALGASHDVFNGASYLVWLYQHMLGHHPYTNIDGADPDIVTAEKDVRRIKATQPWFSFYYNQHIYVPLLYAFLGIKTRVQDVSIMFSLKKNGAIRTNDFSDYHYRMFVIGKLLFVFHRILLPLLLLPVWKFAALFLVADLASSYWLALTFQANHVVDTVEWPLPDKNGHIHQDWAEMQVATTQDYAHHSWFWNVFSGGLNHQTTHHLFPGICQYYYPQISPIVAQTAKEFGIPYHYKHTFTEALGTHIGHLRNLGRNTVHKSK